MNVVLVHRGPAFWARHRGWWHGCSELRIRGRRAPDREKIEHEVDVNARGGKSCARLDRALLKTPPRLALRSRWG